MPIIPECFNYLKDKAIGEWHESYRFKDKETDDYIHPIRRGMLLLRVETGSKRAMYWIYNIQDAILFNEFVGMTLKAEAHEIIISPRCRLFFDIDLALDEFQKHEFAEHYGFILTEQNESEAMDEIGKIISSVFKDSVLISLEEHGVDIDNDLSGFDYMFSMRNRETDNDGYKISIHLITNIMIPLKACSAIVKHIKSEVICDNIDVLGIDDQMVNALINSIDETQYRRHGSLGLPYGTKQTTHRVCTNWIYKDYDIPNQRYLITIEDQFVIHDIDLGEYNIANDVNHAGSEANPEFVKRALCGVSNIADYNPRVWDINASILKRSTMYVKRYAPSMCSMCNRVHDNDNTLFLIFNSEKGIASWKCARKPEMRPIVFYQEEDTESAESVEAFAFKFAKRKSQPTPQTKQKPSPYISECEREDIEAFSMKHSVPKKVKGESISDPFDRAPYKPKQSFMNRSPIAKKYVDDHIECTGEEYDESDIE